MVRAFTSSVQQVPLAYAALSRATEDLDLYEPFCLNAKDQLPEDIADRRKWIMTLKDTPLFDVPFILFYYFQGGNLPMLYWIWKCEPLQQSRPGSEAHNVREAHNGRVATKHETIIAKIVADMPKYATRMEIREMRKAMDQLAKLSREAPRMKKALSLVTAKVATNTIISAPL